MLKNRRKLGLRGALRIEYRGAALVTGGALEWEKRRRIKKRKKKKKRKMK